MNHRSRKSCLRPACSTPSAPADLTLSVSTCLGPLQKRVLGLSGILAGCRYKLSAKLAGNALTPLYASACPRKVFGSCAPSYHNHHTLVTALCLNGQPTLDTTRVALSRKTATRTGREDGTPAASPWPQA